MSLSLQRRRNLRVLSTDAERALWNLVRDRRLAGFKFRRQHPCGPYILDFYCPELKLAVELDGGQHFEPRALLYDEIRTEDLRARGIVVLRFNNDVVLTETTSVLEEIARQMGVQVD
jgi:very-short-patch-repair endonuclease